MGPKEKISRVAIIIGSTRPNRICPEIAEWAQGLMQSAAPSLKFELIDLAKINLPFLDEPLMPALGQYGQQHTKDWSTLISSYQAFVFVFPQYNSGYPAPLKNALDFLYSEWAGKMATIITYGNHGGGKAAAQLKIILQGLHMNNTVTNPELNINDAMFRPDGHFKDIETAFAEFAQSVITAAQELAS